MEEIKVEASFRLIYGEKALGPGMIRLLEGIRRLGSLRHSAAELNMSYNKAWTILRHCEQRLGYPLVRRRVGGSGGGGAELTEQGEDLIERYRAFEGEARQCLDVLSQKYFSQGI